MNRETDPTPPVTAENRNGRDSWCERPKARFTPKVTSRNPKKCYNNLSFESLQNIMEYESSFFFQPVSMRRVSNLTSLVRCVARVFPSGI